MTTENNTRPWFLCTIAATVAVLLASAASASAAGPAWRLDSLSNTTAAPNSTLDYLFQLNNVGDADSSGDFTLSGHLPAGFTANDLTFHEKALENVFGVELGSCAGDGPGGHLSGANNFTCTISGDGILAHRDVDQFFGVQFVLRLSVDVGGEAASTSTATFDVEGGGAPAFSIVDATRITPDPPGFGIEAFDTDVAADPAGHPLTQAAGHPYADTTSIDFNTKANIEPLKGDLWPVEPLRDVVADLPPGFVGSPVGVDQCTASQLANNAGIDAKPLCPETSQVGTTLLRLNGLKGFPNVWGPVPVFNMVPPPGAPARFGFNVDGAVVVLDAKLRSGGDYGLSVDARDVSEGLALAGTSLTFWGVPSDSSHDAERACLGELAPWLGGPSCTSDASPRPFLRNPTSCSGGAGLITTLHIDSWEYPGAFDANGEPELKEAAWQSATSISHELPGYPYPPGEEVGIEGCGEVPFEPQVAVKPTTHAADSPSGLEVDLTMPQKAFEEPEAIAQSDLRTVVVTLPQGMSVNPSSADGLGACSTSQVGLVGTGFPAPNPIHFTDTPANCPDSSKIGTLSIKTPLLDHPVNGAVYLAKQGDNPFGSLLALYLVAEDPQSGTILKLPGEVEAKPDGRLITSFDNQPQLPFEALHVELFGGPRASLRTPASCGTYTARAELSPWSGNPAAKLESSFDIASGPGEAPCPPKPAPFAPKLSAGTQIPIAGSFSPFALRLTREDGTQELAGLSAALPPGLVGKLAGISYCPDSVLAAIPTAEGTGAAQLTNPSCPAASQVGTVTAGAGAGSNPFYLSTGKAYLAGPYKGPPLSMAILTPAVVGPFDLGNVLVRAALRVNPETAQITAVSDPLPTSLFGIPIDLRDIRVNVNRPGFTLNPTSCEPMSVAVTVSGTEGASAALSNLFQVADCADLPFKPKLALSLKGGTHRGDHPAFKALLRAKTGEANIAATAVTLPPSEILDQGHIKTVCTRVQFAAGTCPPGSVYGYAKAWSPLLDQPLRGPVYLRSNGGERELPDLLADLNGQIHVTLLGFIDSNHGRIRNRFTTVPDAPVSKFTLEMKGGKKGLLVNSRDICARPYPATVKMNGQNGKLHDTEPVLKARCKKQHKKGRGHRR